MQKLYPELFFQWFISHVWFLKVQNVYSSKYQQQEPIYLTRRTENSNSNHPYHFYYQTKTTCYYFSLASLLPFYTLWDLIYIYISYTYTCGYCARWYPLPGRVFTTTRWDQSREPGSSGYFRTRSRRWQQTTEAPLLRATTTTTTKTIIAIPTTVKKAIMGLIITV